MPIGSILGGIISSGGYANAGGQASQAGRDVAAAGSQALAESKALGAKSAARLSPWANTGIAAQQQIAALLGLGDLRYTGDANNPWAITNPGNAGEAQRNAMARFQTDPGYQFRVAQGLQAVNNSGASRGMTYSGAQAKALNDYAQGQASQEYGNYFNRLAGVSGSGQSASTAQGQLENQAVIPGIGYQFKGAEDQLGANLAAAGYGAQSQNALASGILGAQNSLINLASFGGSGGKFGLPGWA